MVSQHRFTVTTRGRGTTDLTVEVARFVGASGIRAGICQVFVQHTSASLLITENADPRVRADLETLLGRMAPDGDPAYRHDDEGDDDMAAHARAMITGSGLTVPISDGRLALGTWQGLFLFEHRVQPHVRTLLLTLIGE